MPTQSEVTIGIILRPHGLRGLVKVRPLTDDANRYFALKKVRLHLKGALLGEFALEHVTMSTPKNLLLKFRGRDSINEVEALRGVEIRITRDECLPTAKDQFYHFDLIGLPVQTTTGRTLGTLSTILEHPGNDIWVVHDEAHNELLLPAIGSVIKEVNLEQRRIVIEPLPGLLDDKAEST
ncbi:MAG: ribosome maturation factor RimM [candidate division KSB1 bacterium]